MTERHYTYEQVIVTFRKWLRNYSGGNWARLTGPERQLVLDYHTEKFAAKLPEAVTLGKILKNKLKEKIGRW